MQHRAARQDLEAFRYVGTPDDFQVFRRAARNAAASDALDAAVKIAFRVGLQKGKPGREILRVICAGIVSDAQIGAEESIAEFGDVS